MHPFKYVIELTGKEKRELRTLKRNGKAETRPRRPNGWAVSNSIGKSLDTRRNWRPPIGVSFPPSNVEQAKQLGVKQVALPQPGAKSWRQKKREAQPWFKAALRFRNGIEGRISALKRARQLDRCLNRGEDGLERWVGWGILTNNLVVMAAKLVRRHRSRK